MVRWNLMAIAVAMGLSISAASAQVLPPITELNVEGITVSELAVMAFRDTLSLPFVLSPEVYADTRPLAVHIRSEGKPFFTAVERYFNALGYSIERRGGILSVQPTAAPKAKEPPPPPPRFNRVYRPKYREVAYLVDLLRPLVGECRFGSDRGVSRSQQRPTASMGHTAAVGEVTPEQMASAGPASALGQLDRTPDVLVYNCTEQDRDTVAELLPQLDTPQGELLVRATIYEVSVDKSEASAVALAASLINTRLGLFLNSAVTPQQTAITLKLNNLQAVVSALDQDHRFKVLSSPVARARSGSAAVFQSGQEVPVLGAVSYNAGVGSGSGGLTPIQSVQYRAAGVIFNVLPVQRENVIALDVQQELSDFVQTTTGVNNSPTLNKRSLSSSLSVQPGDVVLLGGLLQDKATGNSQGLSFLPAFLDATTKSDARTEILLVLQVVSAEASGALVAMPGHLPVPVVAEQTTASENHAY